MQRLRLRDGEIDFPRRLSWQLGKQDSTQVLSFENLRLLLSQHAFIHAAWLSVEGMPDPLDGGDILQEHLGNINCQGKSSV